MGQITSDIRLRDIRYAMDTKHILSNMTHIFEATCKFMDCSLDDITWVDVKQFTDQMVILVGVADPQSKIAQHYKRSVFDIEIPVNFLEQSDWQPFFEFLDTRRKTIYNQLIKDSESTEQKVTVH